MQSCTLLVLQKDCWSQHKLLLILGFVCADWLAQFFFFFFQKFSQQGVTFKHLLLDNVSQSQLPGTLTIDQLAPPKWMHSLMGKKSLSWSGQSRQEWTVGAHRCTHTHTHTHGDTCTVPQVNKVNKHTCTAGAALAAGEATFHCVAYKESQRTADWWAAFADRYHSDFASANSKVITL